MPETHFPLPVADASFLPTLTAFLTGEDAARFRDQFQDFVVTGGFHGPGAGLVGSPGATTAYCAGELVTETAGITYPNGASVWVIIDAATAGSRDTFTRVSGTHYLIDTTSVAEPILPTGAVWCMRVTTSGGAVTQTEDLRAMSAVRTLANRGMVFTSHYQTLQDAIDALPAAGGIVWIEPGAYVLTQTLTLGDGGAATVSTRQGIYLVGMGAPYSTQFGFSNSPAVRLVWAGGGSPVVEVRGPLAGWGIQNVAIDGTGSATYGLRVVSAQYGDVRNVCISGALVAGIGTHTVATFGGVNDTSVTQNFFNNVFVRSDGSYGIELTSGAATSFTSYNTFCNVEIVIAGNGRALQLGAAVANFFYALRFALLGGAVAAVNFAFDNGQNGALPADNMFFGLDPGNKPITQTGTAAFETRPNLIVGLVQSGGAIVPDIEALALIYTNKAGDLHLTPSRNEANPREQGMTVVGPTIAGAPIKTVTTHYTMTDVDSTILGDATSGALVVTLQPAIDVPGRIVHVKKVDASANAVFLDAAGDEWIDGDPATIGLTTQWATRTVQSDGQAWFRLDRP